jgi:hypothetical protein
VRGRVKLYSDGFRYTELYSLAYWSDKHMKEAVVANEADAQRLRESLVTYAGAEHNLQRHLDEVINADPLLKPCAPFSARTAFGQGLVPAMARLADYYERAGKPEPEPYRLTDQLDPDNSVAKLFARYMLVRAHPEKVVERLANPGFEDTAGAAAPTGPDWTSENCPPTWGSWVRDGTTAALRWVASPVRSGQRAVMLKGAAGAACYLVDVPAKPGDVFLCTVYAQGKVGQPERATLTVKWHDAQGQWFGEALNQAVQFPRSEVTAWTPMCLMFTVPEGAGSAVVMLSGGDMRPDDVVYFDDCTVQQLDVK